MAHVCCATTAGLAGAGCRRSGLLSLRQTRLKTRMTMFQLATRQSKPQRTILANKAYPEDTDAVEEEKVGLLSNNDSGSPSSAARDAKVDNSGQGLETEASADKAGIDQLSTALAFLFPALGGLLFGLDIGATSGALLSLSSPVTSGTDWSASALSDAWASGAVVSSSLGGALAGSALAFVAGDKLGRRGELLTAGLVYGLASLLLATAPGFTVLLLAHTMYGVGCGLAMHAAPAYIAETAPPSVRGLLISLKEGFIVGGILAGYALSYAFVDEVGGWRYMFGAASLPAAALVAGMIWLPESPRWLVLARPDNPSAALAALRVLKGRAGGGGTAALQRELQVMRESMVDDTPEGVLKKQGIGALLAPPNLRPLAIGTSLMLFQQITGQPSVLYYAATIFQEAGLADASQATGTSVALGTFKLLMTGVAVLTVDRLGRRPLLLAGVSGMVVSLAVLAAAAADSNSAPSLSVGALLLYVGCYQISFGPISWLIIGEIFPLAVRGQAVAIATMTNFGSNFLVSLLLPTLNRELGAAGTYAAFGVIGVVAVASIYATVPETKGRTLEEIEQMWK